MDLLVSRHPAHFMLLGVFPLARSAAEPDQLPFHVHAHNPHAYPGLTPRARETRAHCCDVLPCTLPRPCETGSVPSWIAHGAHPTRQVGTGEARQTTLVHVSCPRMSSASLTPPFPNTPPTRSLARENEAVVHSRGHLPRSCASLCHTAI